MKPGSPATPAKSARGAVLRSSTFRHTLVLCLLVWLPMAAALLTLAWEPLERDPGIEPDELDELVEDMLEEMGVLAWEYRLHRLEHGDGDRGDDDHGDDHDEIGAESRSDSERSDSEPGDSEPFESEAFETEPEPFEPGHWTASELIEILHFHDELRESLDETDFCWHLVDGDGRWLDGNLWRLAQDEPALRLESAKGAELLEVDGAWVDGAEWAAEPHLRGELEDEWNEELDREPLSCSMRSLALDGGGRLRLGRALEPFDVGWALLAAFGLAALGLAVAGGGSLLLAKRAVGFVDDLRLARSRLEQAGLPRLRQPGDGGDFDRAASEINTMLDRLDGALGSLTHVTDNIAHDLRTPLTRLQGQLDVLRRSDRPTEPMIGAVQEEADQLVSTFNALMRIAQVESGHRRKGFRPFDLAQVVSDVGELYGPAFQERRMTFDSRLPQAPLRQLGDPDLWMQALSNLLDNALKYTPDGGRVELELDAGPPPRLTLRDSGPGIPEHEHERVFERFYRLERHRGPQGKRGAGLGLSLVQAICELHRASIRLGNDDGLVVHIEWSEHVR